MSLWSCAEHGLVGPMPCCAGASLALLRDATLKPPMTKEQFIAAYCERSNVTWEWLSKYRTALPCACGEYGCEGWQMVPRAATNQSTIGDKL